MKLILTIEVDDLSELVQVERALRDFDGIDTNEAKPAKTTAKKFIQANSVKALKTLFEEYGAEKLSEIEEENWPEFMEALSA